MLVLEVLVVYSLRIVDCSMMQSLEHVVLRSGKVEDCNLFVVCHLVFQIVWVGGLGVRFNLVLASGQSLHAQCLNRVCSITTDTHTH